jgi:hypothetical protein
MAIPFMYFEISMRSKDFETSTKSLTAGVFVATIAFVGVVEYFLQNYSPWFFRPYSWEDYWLFYDGLNRIPAALTLALFLYVIVPLAFREKNRLQQIAEYLPKREDIVEGLFNRIKMRSSKLLIGFILAIFLLFPSVILYGANRFSFDLSFSTFFFSFSHLNEYISRVNAWSSSYINILHIPSLMAVLYPNIFRILFIRGLLSWCRGKSTRRSVILLGIIGEIWAYFFAPMSISHENLQFNFARTFVPIPLLFILGLLFISRSKRLPAVEIDSVFLGESVVLMEPIAIHSSGMEEIVEIPLRYSFASRLKSLRFYPFKENQAVFDEE